MRKIEDELESQVDLQQLLDNLEFTAENIEEAALNQPKLFYNAGRLRVQTMHAKNVVDTKLDLLRYSLTLALRRKDSAIPKEKGKRVEKKTETHLKEIVSRDAEYKKRLFRLNRAIREEAYAKLLYEAYEMRSQAIRIVANVTGMDRAVEKQMRKKHEELEDARRNIGSKYED